MLVGHFNCHCSVCHLHTNISYTLTLMQDYRIYEFIKQSEMPITLDFKLAWWTDNANPRVTSRLKISSLRVVFLWQFSHVPIWHPRGYFCFVRCLWTYVVHIIVSVHNKSWAQLNPLCGLPGLGPLTPGVSLKKTCWWLYLDTDNWSTKSTSSVVTMCR